MWAAEARDSSAGSHGYSRPRGKSRLPSWAMDQRPTLLRVDLTRLAPRVPRAGEARELARVDGGDRPRRRLVRHRSRDRPAPRARRGDAGRPGAPRPRRRRVRAARAADRRARDGRLALAPDRPPGRGAGRERPRQAPGAHRGRAGRRRVDGRSRRRPRRLAGRGRAQELSGAGARGSAGDPPRGHRRAGCLRDAAQRARRSERDPLRLPRGGRRTAELRRPRRARRGARPPRPARDRCPRRPGHPRRRRRRVPHRAPARALAAPARARGGRHVRGRGRARGGRPARPRRARLGRARRRGRAHAQRLRGLPDALRLRVRARLPRPQGARFGALYALGPALGLDRPEDALALLAACDEVAIDAIETGAVLASDAQARGDRAALLARIEDLVERGGADAPLHPARRQSLRADASLAAVLGQCVGARGSDPMRTLPFLLSDAPVARLRELLGPIPLPRGAEDARDPAGKGGSCGGTRT